MLGVLLGIGVLSVLLSNFLYDKGVPNYLSRKVGHIGGGLAYFLSKYLTTPLEAFLLSLGVFLVFILARVWAPHLLRGVGGSGRPHAYAEITYVGAGTLCLGIGWVWLGSWELAVLPILFFAWGDSITGIIRSVVYKKEVKGMWGSLGMLVVCLGVSSLYSPYWMGVISGVSATIAEKLSPLAKGVVDDNWIIPLVSLSVLLVLRSLFYGIG